MGLLSLAAQVMVRRPLHLCKYQLSLFPGITVAPRLSGSLCRFRQVHSTGVTCYLISRGHDTSLSRGWTPGLEPRGASLPSGQRLLCLFPAGLYVLVGAGALMMAVGFFGCCGAMRESQCVLGSVSGASGRELV